MADEKTGLVITAHPGDFVWRAGGAIALHAKRGYRVKIVCLSYGERGESQLRKERARVHRLACGTPLPGEQASVDLPATSGAVR